MKKLFGETPQEQLRYLQPRLIITAIAIVITAIGMLFHFDEISAVLALALLMWGWTFLKAKFGFASLAAVFSGNIVAGVAIMIAFVFIGYFFGIAVFILGLIQYIRLKVGGI